MMSNPSSFSKTYGEMFVAGYVTGAYFTGVLTLSTNDKDIYNKISQFGVNVNLA